MLRNLPLLVLNTIIITSCVASDDEVMHCREDLLPGIRKLTYGVDITELDLFPKTQKDGFKKPIIELTCTKGRKFRNTYDKEVYSIPDQILEVFMTPRGESHEKAKIYNTITDIQESLAIEVGLDVSVPLYGSFSSSNTYKRMEETLNSLDKFISSISASVAGFRADGWNGTFSERVLEEIDGLPENYSTDPNKYQQFIKDYGTHYFTHGIFGGKLQVEFVTSKDLRKKMNDKEISAHVEASFMEYVKVNGGVDVNDKRSNEIFSSNSRNNSFYYGGITNLLMQDWSKWWDTVAANPWLTGGNLITIDEIFPKNSSRKAAMKFAIKSYLMKKALPLYYSRLDNFIAKNLYGLDQAKVLQNQLVAIIQMESIINVDRVDGLLKNIDSYINPPKGWFEHTRLCYGCTNDDPVCTRKYSACYAVNDGKTAIKPSKWFSSTSGSGSIGLLFTPNLAWLNTTKLCLLYLPRGYRMCASPNTHTDDVSKHHLYRQEPMLYVNVIFEFDLKEAPGWFLNTRLCTGITSEKYCCTLAEARTINNLLEIQTSTNIFLETDSF